VLRALTNQQLGTDAAYRQLQKVPSGAALLPSGLSRDQTSWKKLFPFQSF
jgi:hypothetical protein